MKDGVSTRDAYQHALTYIKNHMPDLEKFFVKNIGFAVSTISRKSHVALFANTSVDWHRIPRCWVHSFSEEQPLFEKKHDPQSEPRIFWAH